MQKLRITFVGTIPLLVHNTRLVDPLDSYTKRMSTLTAKLKKSDEDHEAISRAQWEGGMYWDEDIGPYLPGEMIEAAIRDGAKRQKLGAAVTRSLVVTDDRVPIEYDGPRDLDGMWKDGRFRDRRAVKVGQARVIRTRPVFHQWAVTAEGVLDTRDMGVDDLANVAELAGMVTGMGDYRPRRGRFDALVEAL